jgi:hypothetical protein
MYIAVVGMDIKKYRKAFEDAKTDLEDALKRKVKAANDLRSAEEDTVTFRRAVTILAVLCGENVEDSIGLTEAVRAVVPANAWLTFKSIKSHVEQLGALSDNLKNPDASVLSVLTRLVTAGELEQRVAKVGNPAADAKVWTKTEKGRQKAAAAGAATVTDDDIPF